MEKSLPCVLLRIHLQHNPLLLRAFVELLLGVGQLVGCCRDKAFTCEFYLIQARHMEPFI